MLALFCTVPVSAWHNTSRPGMEPNFGASEIVGVLKEAGIDVIHLDLNAALNSFEDLPPLSFDDFNIFSNVNRLKIFLEDPSISFSMHTIFLRLRDVVASYVNDSKIDFVCFSLSHNESLYPEYRLFYSLTGFNCSIILRKYLDFVSYNAPIYCGGRNIHRALKYGINSSRYGCKPPKGYSDYFDYIANTLPLHYLPLYYITNGTEIPPDRHDDGSAIKEFEEIPSWGSEYQFAEHILNNLDNDKAQLASRTTIDTLYLNVIKDKQVTYIADLKSNNFKCAELSVDDSFPTSFLNTYSEFKNIKPFNYYNYRFSEGCIFKCAFCYHSLSDWVLKDDVITTVDKLEKIYDSGVTYLRFFNDNINFKKSWTKEFCNEIVKRNIKIRWSDSANTKVNDKDMFLAMSEAGCRKLWFGIDSVSPRILKEIGKWTNNLQEKVHDTLTWSHEAGIWNCTNFIINFPHESEDEYEMVRSFLKEYYEANLINTFNVQPLAIFKTSGIYQNPEKFKIKIFPNKSGRWGDISWGAQWAEMLDNNMSTPESIIQRGETRIENFLKTIDFDIPTQNVTDACLLFENDYLFFAMVDRYDIDTEKFKEIYHYILTNIDMCNELITSWGHLRLKRQKDNRELLDVFKLTYF